MSAESAVIDGEAVLPRADGSFDFEGLRSREGQASAVPVAYDMLELEGEDVPLSLWRGAGSVWRGYCERRPSGKACSSATRLPATRADIPPRLRDEPSGDREQAPRLALRQRPDASMAQNEEPEFSAVMSLVPIPPREAR